MKSFLGISNFLEETSSLSNSIVLVYFFAFSLKKAFLSLLAIPWNSALKCLYLWVINQGAKQTSKSGNHMLYFLIPMQLS